jgi:hypothetical protein
MAMLLWHGHRRVILAGTGGQCKVFSAVGGTLDSAEGESKIEDCGIPLSEADVDRLSHSAWEGWVCRPAVFPTDLIHQRLLSGQVLFDTPTRRWWQGNIAGVNI